MEEQKRQAETESAQAQTAQEPAQAEAAENRKSGSKKDKKETRLCIRKLWLLL